MPVVFGRTVQVSVVRGAGTPQYRKWEGVGMAGDLKHKALFQPGDRFQRGDEVECQSLWDEPRIITRVDAVTTMSGLSHWEAQIVPKSEWESQRIAPMGITISGQGSRVNIGSIDQSTQSFGPGSDTAEIVRLLEQIAEAIKQLNRPAAERKDALLDVEQVKLELQRSRPEASRIWTLLERLKGIAELGEQISKLAPLLQPLIERLPG